MNQLITVLAALPLLGLISFEGGSCNSRNQQNAVAKEVAVETESRMTRGTWGGNQISMEVSEEGARIEYDCAHGTVSEPIKLDGQGKFSAKGTHFREKGGPQRADDENKGEPVIYSGTTDGKTATLTVTNSVTDEVIGTFTLTLGKRSRLTKCL